MSSANGDALVNNCPTALPYRVGHGFDLHRLEEGPYKLILGGLEIPHDRGCVAHSDGDCCALLPLVHSLIHKSTTQIAGLHCSG